MQPQAQAQAKEVTLAPPPMSVLVVPAKNGVTYWNLEHNGAEVMYRPHDGLVNVTQLVQALGNGKDLRWTRMESKIGKMHRVVVKGK